MGYSYKKNTGFGYVELYIDLISVDKAANTSKWDCKLYIQRNGGATGSLQGNGLYSVRIDGKSFSGSVGLTGFGTKSISLGNVTFTHNADGRKTITVEYSIDVGTPYGTISYSHTGAIDRIVLPSRLTVSNGTLGVAQALTVTRQFEYATHVISYKCGKASGSIPETSETALTWTPSASYANYAPENTSIEATITIQSYTDRNGFGQTVSRYKIGEFTYTISLAIPSSFKPTCQLSLTEETAHYSKYGAYVSGRSKLAASITPTISYSSEIALYQITGFGTTHNEQECTLTASGTGAYTISATVRDMRGRTGSDSEKVTVIPYEKPNITTLKVKRCNSDGVENINGTYCQVTFGGVISSLNGKNTAAYKLGYKKTSATSFTEISLSSSVVSAGSYIFAAEDSSSYDVKLTVTDDLDVGTATTTLSTAGVLIHFGESGNALGLGKIAEIEGGLDIGYKTRFFGGIIHPVIESGANLNNVTTPNTYVGNDASSLVNKPTGASGAFTLQVEGVGTGNDIRQTFKAGALNCERVYSGGAWGSWQRVFAGNNVLWSGQVSTSGTASITFSESVSKQPNGICVVFRYNNGYLYKFIPKYHVENFNNGVIGFNAEMYYETEYGNISSSPQGKIYFRLSDNGMSNIGSWSITYELIAVIGV